MGAGIFLKEETADTDAFAIELFPLSLPASEGLVFLEAQLT